ncbi:DUF2142 domain-containing protein [Leucobacter sp. W1038]|uniref:DUF2142 domain-containing protein n=1 Tax=Leucobacter sp. W1038 TaxID=3438281 RepID=UPI003D954BF7
MKLRRWQRFALAVATAVFAFIGLGAWAIASPVGAAPDDDYHLASIWCAWGERADLCAPGDTEDERVVPERLVEASDCFWGSAEKSAACWVTDETDVSTSRGNFTGHYPPVFYAVMGMFASPDIAVSTVLMRLFNAAVFVGAVSAIIALLRPGQRGPIIWGALVTLVPLGVFIIPSVNPSSWAVLAGLTVWIATYGFFTAASRPRAAALAALAVVLGAMGAGARGDSAVYVAFGGVIAAILAFEKSRSWLKRALLPLGLIIIGAFFFLTATQSTGAATAGAAVGLAGAGGSSADPVEPVSQWGTVLANFLDLPWLWTGGTGTWALGWLDTPVPNSVWVVMIGLLFAVVLWGLQVTNWRKGIAISLTLLALIAVPLYVLYGLYARVGDQVQPRYLLPLVVICVSVVVVGFTSDTLGLNRLQTGVIFAGIALAYALSLHNNMRRYISGLGDSSFNLNADIEWWWSMPLQPMTVWLLGCLAFVLMLMGLFVFLHSDSARMKSAKLETKAAL